MMNFTCLVKDMTTDDEEKRVTHLEKLLVENNPRSDEKITTLDEWVKFAMDNFRSSFLDFNSVDHQFYTEN